MAPRIPTWRAGLPGATRRKGTSLRKRKSGSRRHGRTRWARGPLHKCQSGGRQCAPGLCPVRTAHRRHEPRVQGRSPGGFPTAFDSKSGARAESEAPGALPIKIQRSHLQKSGPSPGGIPAGGWRAGVVAPHGLVDTRASGRPQVAPTSSAQVTDHSLRRKRQSSFPPLCLLSPRRPLRWVAAGAPWNGHSSCHVPAGGAAGMPRPTGS